jgi:hypothetical protein
MYDWTTETTNLELCPPRNVSQSGTGLSLLHGEVGESMMPTPQVALDAGGLALRGQLQKNQEIDVDAKIELKKLTYHLSIAVT